MDTIDFDTLFIKAKELDEKELKKRITPKNIKHRDDSGNGILTYLICNTKGRTDLLEYFFKMGASLELDSEQRRDWSLLHFASRTNTPEVVRLLLDWGVPVNITDGTENVLDCALMWQKDEINQRNIVKTLIDAGGITDNKFFWLEEFKNNRKKIRQTATCVLCLVKAKSRVIGKNRKDILSIIGRCVWNMRGINLECYLDAFKTRSEDPFENWKGQCIIRETEADTERRSKEFDRSIPWLKDSL